jgi:hypothetical protein
MDYIRFRGEYDDVPLEEIQETFKGLYSRLSAETVDASFDDDVDQEQTAVSQKKD